MELSHVYTYVCDLCVTITLSWAYLQSANCNISSSNSEVQQQHC
jgi:hypothetical protein